MVDGIDAVGGVSSGTECKAVVVGGINVGSGKESGKECRADNDVDAVDAVDAVAIVGESITPQPIIESLVTSAAN